MYMKVIVRRADGDLPVWEQVDGDRVTGYFDSNGDPFNMDPNDHVIYIDRKEHGDPFA